MTLNDRVLEILNGFEQVYLSEEKINKIKGDIRKEMKESRLRYNKLERESEESARKIYITC